MVAGCSSCPQRVVTTTSLPNAACEISSDSVRRLTRAEFVAWAGGIPFDSADVSYGQAHGSATAGITVLRAQDMDRATRLHLADGCLIAKIRSTTADPTLGLAAGWTYIWADSTNPFTATAVPEDPSAPLTAFEMSLTAGEPAPGTVASPRYVCSDCGNDWCVYPRDGTRLEPALFAAGGG